MDGALWGKDYWTLAHEFLAAKRGGKVDGTCAVTSDSIPSVLQHPNILSRIPMTGGECEGLRLIFVFFFTGPRIQPYGSSDGVVYGSSQWSFFGLMSSYGFLNPGVL